jgi:hypothetical protein
MDKAMSHVTDKIATSVLAKKKRAASGNCFTLYIIGNEEERVP